MNIRITYDWLLEYLDTDATPEELQKFLSLCGPSVERVDKVGDDFVLDIEITSNRVDTASVFGIAQEAAAILPRFGKKAKLRFNPLKEYKFSALAKNTANKNFISIEVTDPSLATRISAVILSNIKLEDSPEFIKERLEVCGHKTINNVVDISNYLRIALGQPCHVFDYDKIASHEMVIQESRKNEQITTLDGRKFELPGGDIIIKDGRGEVIDLAAIMGAMNSAVTADTKNILFFVPVFDKKRVRRTSMITGQRSDSVTYFEKGLDEERVEQTLTFGVSLLEKYAGGRVTSGLYDIYPAPYRGKSVKTKVEDISRHIGVELKEEEIKEILTSLGFGVEGTGQITVSIPSWRAHDIEGTEDIVEEVARIYGYHNLPSGLQPINIYIKQPKDFEKLFRVTAKIKYFLKGLGLNEQLNYSMISKTQIENLGLKAEDSHLVISNPITEDLKYMRASLFPSLISNIKENTGKTDLMRFFEVAKIYLPQELDLPQEEYKLAIATNTDFFDLKGMIEALLNELHIRDFKLQPANIHLFKPRAQLNIIAGSKLVGSLGQLKTELQLRSGLKNPVYLAGINLSFLIDNYRLTPSYSPVTPYATVKLDLTIDSGKGTFENIKTKAFEISKLLKNIEVLDMYENKMTLRFYFSSVKKNITENQAINELKKIGASVSKR